MRILFFAAALAAAGCVDAGLDVNPHVAMDLMRGYGGAHVGSDGKRSFRYVFPPQAGTNRAHHEAMIGQWAARADGCPKGWSIASIEKVQGNLVYSGPCR